MHPFRTLSIALGLLALGASGWAQYSCPVTDHCYGLNTWMEQPEYFGAYTDISLVSMSCATCDGIGFVDDKLWLVDDFTPECAHNPFHQCFVTVGYMASAGWQEPYLYWSDASPGNGYRFAALRRTTWLDTDMHYMVVKDGRSAPASVLLFIYDTSLSTLFSAVSPTVSGNPMKADRILIGQELVGTHGASAGGAAFTRNLFPTAPLGPEYIFWATPETSRGELLSEAPPWVHWRALPGSPGAPEGGKVTTHCCS